MKIKNNIVNANIMKPIVWCHRLSKYYNNENKNCSEIQFFLVNFRKIKVVKNKNGKINQICDLIDSVGFDPVKNVNFFYSIDPFKTIDIKLQQLDNYSIDYNWCVNSSFNDLYFDEDIKSEYEVIENAMKLYLKRARENAEGKYLLKCLDEVETLFVRPAEHFHEAIQRILFINQWLWQTGHKHNGFGHLDWILYDLYQKDIDEGYMTRDDARKYLVDFFVVLHDKCWFKSTMLLGDTGQIIILGGLKQDTYLCNDLTYLFIQVSKELKLPDPKVLLRVSNKMPDELLALALECIATGIGAPFLSNDDVVIASLIQFGYDKEDAYNYATSACWEPLTIGNSCDQNNIRTVNICEPFIKYLDSDDFENCKDVDEVKFGYYKALEEYLDNFLAVNLDNKEFEEDPLLTLFNPEIIKTGKDIVRGGAKYANLGLTSVGMSTVVNSLINLSEYVFNLNRYTLHELNSVRKNNYEGNEIIRQQLNKESEGFGNDSERVITLTKEIMYHISDVLEKHQTKLGGRYKIGLSSPNYIVDSKNTGATFDGRKAGDPFGVHISGKNGLPPTELISFASQLDYNGNRINGNVIDFIMSPGFINKYFDRAVALIKGGIKQGFYQLQINVVDSKTLIEAQKCPEQFPNLVVRVWGFSAYFRDLPKEYQDNMIKRAIEAEQAI